MSTVGKIFIKDLIRLVYIFFCLFLSTKLSGQPNIYSTKDGDNLANGKKFNFWEVNHHPSRIYHVAQLDPRASDDNPGTEKAPFLTIQKAAQILQPGEKVIIHEGVYRESIHPINGGTEPRKLIIYEAADGESVVVKGSVILGSELFFPGRGWDYGKNKTREVESNTGKVTIWEFDLSYIEFGGYNPFGMLNLMHDREYLQYKQNVNMDPHFKRRGMIFLDGIPIEQVLKPIELAGKDCGAFWVEHNGLRIHVRFPNHKGPADYLIEAAIKEQLFVPEEYGIGYIKIKGINFKHAANGFPVPQRGLISSNRGHHWIIEDCIIEWANSVGADMGNEMWHTTEENDVGYHIFRRNIIRNCGIAGLEALKAPGFLVTDNLFENIGWQDAELAFESGAIKFHKAQNCLIRRNVFRNITTAPGIWLDYLSNKNCRITQNVFTGITTARGAIYIEVSRNDCLVDHNIFHNLKCRYWLSGDYGAGGSALYTDGSDSIRFSNNLVFNIENTGYLDYLNAERIVGTRGGLTRWHSVTDNIFIDCQKHAIEFANEYNYANRNVYVKVNPGYIKIGNPTPALLLDISACQKVYGWENSGETARISCEFDPEILEMSIFVEKELMNKFAGPFKNIYELKNVSIDPRILVK